MSGNKGVVAVDVLRLIDRLEGMVSSGTRIPMTSRAIIDEQEFLDLVDQIRVAFPEELRKARKLNQEQERLLGQAQAEAERIINDAHERVASLVANSEVVTLAQRQAEDLLAQANERAAEIRNDADAYAVEVLSRLEGELQRILAQIRKGRALLEKSSQDLQWSEARQTASGTPGNGSENASGPTSVSKGGGLTRATTKRPDE